MSYKGKRVMRFVGNRLVPEPNLFDPTEIMLGQIFGVDWGQKIPTSMNLADLRKFSKTCPNPLTSDFSDSSDPGTVFIPKKTNSAIDNVIFAHLSALATYPASGFDPTYNGIEREPKPEPVEEPFEVNLTEPLVGWRRWVFTKPAMSAVSSLRSLNSPLNSQRAWKPLQAIEAKCTIERGSWGRVDHQSCCIPSEHCTCGIYAVDDPRYLPDPNIEESVVIIGSVYGWGRYVRGENGWRAQFAYPKEFHLRSFQKHLIEPLRAFGVPIFCDEVVKVFNPEDEGYTNGNWTPKEDGNQRTAENPDPEED